MRVSALRAFGSEFFFCNSFPLANNCARTILHEQILILNLFYDQSCNTAYVREVSSSYNETVTITTKWSITKQDQLIKDLYVSCK